MLLRNLSMPRLNSSGHFNAGSGIQNSSCFTSLNSMLDSNNTPQQSLLILDNFSYQNASIFTTTKGFSEDNTSVIYGVILVGLSRNSWKAGDRSTLFLQRKETSEG